MGGGADGLPRGYRIECHAHVSAPITLGGVPRGLAIGIGIFGLIVSLPLKMPYLGIPLAMAIWAAAYRITKDDPYYPTVVRRHIYHPSHLEG
jgi:type IV secretion system protein VirB3